MESHMTAEVTIAAFPAHESLQFHLEQARDLRAEVLERIKALHALERNSIVAIAGVWTWLASRPDMRGSWTWCVPVLLAALAAGRFVSFHQDIRRIAGYTRVIERRFASGELIGWETHLSGMKKPTYPSASVALWITLVGLTLAVMVWQRWLR
jgi:hypothetical protein